MTRMSFAWLLTDLVPARVHERHPYHLSGSINDLDYLKMSNKLLKILMLR